MLGKAETGCGVLEGKGSLRLAPRSTGSEVAPPMLLAVPWLHRSVLGLTRYTLAILGTQLGQLMIRWFRKVRA